MQISIIKKINEAMPYWIKRPFAKQIRSKLISNRVFRSEYAELEQYDRMTEDEKSEKQLSALKSVLIHAYEHTEYYHKVFDQAGVDVYHFNDLAELQYIPVLTKEKLKAYFDEMSADDIDNYYTVTTGGSSGEPTRILMEKDAIYKEWAFVYHYWANYGYDYAVSKLATFRGVGLKKKLCEINPLYQEIRMNPFLLNNDNIETYIEKIQKFGAEFIYGYPSAIYNFCRIAKNKGICLKGAFKAAFLISENLYSFQESIIREVLGCEIAMFYGHSERAVFAEKCGLCGGYQFNGMYWVTEISDLEEPIATGFINKKMPLIRYVVDDRAVKQKNGLYYIEGHHDSEVLYGKNGEQISMAAINFHDDTFDGIQAYQFVQDEIGACMVSVTAEGRLPEETLKKIKSRMQSKLGAGFSCEVQQVPNIVLTTRGKYKMLIQNCPLNTEES